MLNNESIVLKARYEGILSYILGFDCKINVIDIGESCSTCSGDEHFSVGITSLDNKKIIYSSTINMFPGNCRIYIFNNTYTYPAYRNKSIGKQMNKFKQELLKFIVHSNLTVLCTVTKDNLPELSVLKSLRWEQVSTISDGNVLMFKKDI